MADSPTKAKAEAFPPYDDCLEHSSSSSSDDGELSFADELQEPSILDDIFSDDDDEVEEHEEENQEEEEEKEPKEDVEGQHQKKKLGMSSNEVQQKELNNNNKQEVCGKPTQKLFGACIDGDNAKIKRVCSHSDSESDSSSDSNAVDRSDNRSEPDKAASGKAEVPEHKVQENTSHPQAVGPCGKADASEVEPRGKHDDHNNNNNNNNNNNDINAGQMPPKEHEQENEVEWHGQGQDTAMQAPDSTSRALEVSPKHVVHLREAEHFPGPQEQFPQQKEEKKAPQKGHEHEQKKRELPDTQVNTEATSQFGLLGRIPVDLSESDTDLDLEVPAGTTPAPSLALAEATVCNHKSPTGLDEPSPVTPPQQATVPLGQEARLLRRSHGEAAAAGGTYPDDTACSQHPIQQQALLDTENGSRSRSRSRSRNPRTRRGNQGAHKSTSSASGIRSNSSKSSKSSKSRSSTSSSSTCSKASSPSSTTASKPRRHRRRHRHRRQHRCHRDSALGQHDSKGSHEQGQEHELEHEHELKRGEHHHHHHQHELDEAPDGYAATAAAAAAPRGLKRRREKRRRGGQRIRKLREEMQRRHQEKQARKSSQTGQGSHSPNEVYVTGFGPHLDKAGVAQLFESLFEQLWEYREHFGVGNSNEGKRGRGRSGVAGANKKEKQMKNKKNMTAAVKSVNLDPSRGFTFMEFEDEVLRQTACALSGYRLPHGRKLIVRPAQGVSAEVPLSLNVSPLISPEERDVGTGGKRASSLFSQVWIGKLPQVYRENHGFLREDVERILRADPAVRARYGNKNLILSVRFGVDDYFAYLHLLDEALAAAMVALGELKTQSGDVMWLRWPNGNREGERSRHPPRATFVLTQPQPDPPKCEEDTRNVFHSGDKYDLCSDYFRHSSNSCDPSNVNVPKWSSNSCATASNRGSCRGSTSSNTVGAAVFSSGSGGISINNSSRRRSDEGCLSADHQQQERQQQQQHHHHHQQQQHQHREPQLPHPTALVFPLLLLPSHLPVDFRSARSSPMPRWAPARGPASGRSSCRFSPTFNDDSSPWMSSRPEPF